MGRHASVNYIIRVCGGCFWRRGGAIMSMIDGFFNKGFKASKGKTLLKLTIPRIKLLRNKRDVQIKQMRRDISKLLQTGQEATARIRVEHIIREENMMAAHEIIELFCELISVRLPIIETQRECPLDLKEAISSLCFAAPRCADLPELLQLHSLFSLKYGKDFAAAASDLLPNCAVNRQLVELLSVRAPSPGGKLKLLKEIAEEFEVDWDPAISEAELLKPPDDLLNGPSQFFSGVRRPLPAEKHVEDDDPVLEMLDFPEVPRASPKGDRGGVKEPGKGGDSREEEADGRAGAGVEKGELNDVLGAAKAAAETAERAATAAREAEVRMKEILKRGEEEENPFYGEDGGMKWREDDQDGIFSYPDLYSRGPNV